MHKIMDFEEESEYFYCFRFQILVFVIIIILIYTNRPRSANLIFHVIVM